MNCFVLATLLSYLGLCFHLWIFQSLPEMGEIYPLGGAGDRLGLVDEVTGESLPVAMLPYCGRTLLEGLIRDLQVIFPIHRAPASFSYKEFYGFVCDMI